MTDHPRAKLARILLTVAYMGLIFWVSSIPGPELPVPSGIGDYVLHFGEYFLLGVLLWFSATSFVRIPGIRHLALAAVIGTLYGVSDEWHQSFVPYREATARDVLFDALGVVTGLLFVYAVQRRKRAA